MRKPERLNFLHSVIDLNPYKRRQYRGYKESLRGMVISGIGSGELQDLIFTSQETNILSPRIYKYPLWGGIGTARLCEDIGDDLDELYKQRKIYCPLASRYLSLDKPIEISQEAKKIIRVFKSYYGDSLSSVAAYLASRRRAIKDNKELKPKEIIRAAASRLGWSGKLISQLEDARKQLIQMVA